MIPGMTTRLLLVVGTVLFLAACAPEPLVRPDTPEKPGAAAIATLIDAGRHDQALAELERQLAPLADPEQARLRLDVAERLLAADQVDQARTLLGQVRASDLTSDGEVRLAMAWAEAAIIEGDGATAGWLLAQVSERVPEELADRYSALERRLQALADRPADEAVRTLGSSLRAGDFEPELALALLIEFPLAVVRELFSNHGHRPELAPWLDLAVTAREFLLDEERLETALLGWQQRHPNAGYRADEAALWLAAWRQIQPAPARVAVILPGPESNLARPGRALRDGLLSAWAQRPPEQRPELRFLYTSDTPDDAINAWFSARELGADFVIGPLDRAQVDALLELGDATLPLLLLNHPSDPRLLSEFPGLVSAHALIPEEEAEMVAARALVEGHSRALVLRQDTDWGARLAQSFSESFRLGGGEIVRDTRYATSQVDHSILLEVVLGLDRSRERAAGLGRLLGVPLENEPARRTDADLIFLASRADDARAIRPQLAFFGAGDIPVMATSHVIAGPPDPRRDQDLDQVLLPLPPWFLDNTRQGQVRRQAEGRYQGLDSPALSRLFALGADALSLLPWLDHMRSDPALYLPGLTGRLRLDRHGRIERDLPFVRIVDGRAVIE
ncbi:MAG: hypothetical protein EA419_06195 [Wenzhouxiangella sp.]|nr:MAG: hypothetical protein EA419_06195 [Wenzhouxiangella sp.]